MARIRNEKNPIGNIALFFHGLGMGGAERVMLELARGFLEAGHAVDLVLARAEGPLLSEVPSQARIVDFKTKNPFMMFVRLIRYLLKENPSVLLSPFEVTSVIAIVAKKLSRVSTKVVVRVSVHLSRNKRATRWKKIVERLTISRVYPLADGIVAVSRGVAADLAAYTGMSSESITVIYNPVISPRLIEMMEQTPDHPFFSDDHRPVILGVGRLEEQKDFPTLIRAFEIVHRKILSRLIILGDGEDRQALRTLIESLSLNDWVDLPGTVQNPFAFMKRVSVFVLSSKWEGLPNVLIQALACGCPVVSTDCLSGPGEILKGGEYGHLVPVGDAEAIAAAIEEVLKGRFRKPPKAWLDQFTLGEVIPQYEMVFGI
jgi:glycosyltransferase involved in cell wall biosynthesis